MQLFCPQCSNPVEVADTEVSQEAVCASCGSNFHVERESSTVPVAFPASQVGRFQLLETVGRGGFGTVYKARDPELDRIVAIKVPRATILTSSHYLDRFLREARSVAQLRHPSIVPVHEVGQANGMPFLVSEFVHGITLADLLTARRPAPQDAARLMAQVADALQYAHEHGVIHRDVKPSNIMLETIDAETGGRGDVGKEPSPATSASPRPRVAASFVPRLMDFGLAKRDAGEITMTWDGQVLGTPAYMSPEQARGEGHRVDGRSDVYSLGVILYQLLTGELPFRGSTRMLLHQVLTEDPRSPRSLNDRIPRDLETVCLKAMAKEPGRRYRTAKEFADDLRRFVNGEPIRARPVGRAEKLWRWCSRKPALAMTSGVAAVALVLATIVSISWALYYFRALEESQRREAGLALDRGLRLCEQGQGAEGLLWLARSLQLSPPADEQFRRLIRLNLAACAGQLHPLRAVLPQADAVAAVAFNPDGQTILTASGNRAELWDAASGRPLDRLFAHDKVSAVAFSPDGKFVLTGGADFYGRLWETATGRAVGQPLPHKGLVSAVAFSPDGKTILTASWDKTVGLWESATGSPLGLLQHPDLVYAAAFSPDGKTILTGCSDGIARLWDAATEKPIDHPTLQHGGRVNAVAFSPDGKTFATGCGDKTVRLWKPETWKPGTASPFAQFVHQGNVIGVAFSPDGHTLLAGTEDNSARLWDIVSKRPLGAPLHHQGRVTGVAFSPCSKIVVTAGKDRTVRIWEGGPLEPEIISLPHPGRVYAGVFSPDGKTALTGGDHGAQLWDVATGTCGPRLAGHQGPVLTAAFSPDGKRVVTGSRDKKARLWNADTGEPGPSLPHAELVRAVAFSPNSKTVLTGSLDRKARLWEVDIGRVVELPHPDFVWAVAFSPDGSTLLTGCGSANEKRGEARLWNAVTGRPLGPPLPHRSTVFSIAFSPDGRTILTGSADETARLWDASTGRQIGELQRDQGTVHVVAFSPDGRTILTGSSDKLARLWETASLKLLGRLAHPGPVFSAAFSRDGQMVLTGSEGNAARLWDTPTGQALGPPLRHEGPVREVAFSPNGKTVLTVSDDTTARLWKVPAALEGEVQRIVLWTQLITGMEVDDAGQTQVLDAQTWQDRRRRLEGLGGPPVR